MSAELEERTPKLEVAENVTVSPCRGFPFKVTRAVIAEVIVEPAAIVSGIAERDNSPDVITMDVERESVAQYAVMEAVPVAAPGLNVTVA